jgi:hypothetical protein
VQLARLLAGRQIDDAGLLKEIEAKALRELWLGLRTPHPEAFAPLAVEAWHRRQAEASEAESHWFAALVHCERIVAINSQDAAARQRRETAAARLREGEQTVARRADLPSRIPARQPLAGANLIDLSAHYNAALTETWFPTNVIASGNDLSALPQGVQKFNGVEFDVRGLIQLAGSELESQGGRFPHQATGIAVGRPARRLHFLQGAAWDALYGTKIGYYRVNYTNGETREVRLIFGEHVRDWWFAPSQRQWTTSAAVAWEGSNTASRQLGKLLRIYQMTWLNPSPEVAIASIDFVSTLEKPAPFLIAITVE